MAAAGRQCILKGKKRQRQLEVIIAIALTATTSACPLVVSTGRRRSLVLLHGGFSEFPGLPLAFVEDDGQIHVVLPHVVRSAVLRAQGEHLWPPTGTLCWAPNMLRRARDGGWTLRSLD